MACIKSLRDRRSTSSRPMHPTSPPAPWPAPSTSVSAPPLTSRSSRLTSSPTRMSAPTLAPVPAMSASTVFPRQSPSPPPRRNSWLGMVDLMVEAAILLSNSWESLLEHTGDNTEIVIDEGLRKFSADVVSRACFGSSFADGKEIFSGLRKLQMVLSKSSILIGIPGLRC